MVTQENSYKKVSKTPSFTFYKKKQKKTRVVTRFWKGNSLTCRNSDMEY